MNKKLYYPFTAIVGQEKMKKALILNLINPKIGGVLIKGEKGTAKSTTVRALSKLITNKEVVEGCLYNCNPRDINKMCDECKYKYSTSNINIITENMEVVNLPVNATEDRVVGSIDMEKAIKTGKKAFEPGILAKANRNILYVDEVNLLDDHIVDILLDSAAMGVNIVEREGISIKHESNFTLVGTMNPEEGELRPQLLDRFALCVDIEGIKNVDHRVEIINRRIKYEENPEEFIEEFKQSEIELQDKIEKAKLLLNKVEVDMDSLRLIASLSISCSVDGHRADLCMIKTAKTIAAFEGRTNLLEEDIKSAASLVLPHRLRKNPFDDSQIDEDIIDKVMNDFNKNKEEMNRPENNDIEKKMIVS